MLNNSVLCIPKCPGSFHHLKLFSLTYITINTVDSIAIAYTESLPGVVFLFVCLFIFLEARGLHCGGIQADV